ncbi:MAG: glycosyltransferase family 17 protein [Planctomycetota bacterium]|jgi:beta-1,4-mannosyl-glycoprotein beta-1,4-N-acetylglucosaminyltransferase
MIYNCFPFYDEFMMLDIRLAELGDVVDKFVLVESTMTYSGRPKPLFFSDAMERYANWKDKLIALVSHRTAVDEDAWENERTQRNSIGDYLNEVCSDDDLIILTDADEIVRRETIERTAELRSPGRLLMKMYYYWFNSRLKGDWPWPAFCRWCDYVDVFHRKGQSLRISTMPDCPRIENAGWHFSYIMDAHKIANKIGAFSHSEYDTPHWRNEERIEKCRQNMVDLYDRFNYVFDLAPMSEMPEEIQDHPERYSEFIKELCPCPL